MTDRHRVQRARDVEAIIRLWEAGMHTIPPPPVSQFELWFDMHHDFTTVAYGIQECIRLYNQRLGVMDLDHCVRHSSKVMNVYRRDRARLKKPDDRYAKQPSYQENVRAL